MRRFLTLLCVLCLCAAPAVSAWAAEVAVVSAASPRITLNGDYLILTCPLNQAGAVSLTVACGGQLTYQRSWADYSGDFRSDAIYLPLQGDPTVYQLTLTTPDGTRTVEVTRERPQSQRLQGCTAGYPLPGSSAKTLTLLDTAALAQSPVTVALYSGSAQLGTATFSLKGGSLHTTLQLQEGVQLEKGTVWVSLTAAACRELASGLGTHAPVGEDVPLHGATLAAVYLPVTVTVSGPLPDYRPATLPGQEALWQRLQTESPQENG